MEQINVEEFYKEQISKFNLDSEEKKVSGIRKAIFPLFEQLVEKINIITEIKKGNITQKIEGKVSIDKWGELEEKQNIANKILTQILNKIKPSIINVVEKVISFPEIQKIKGKVTVTRLDKIEKDIEFIAETLLNKKYPEFPYQKDERIPVKIMEYTENVQGGTPASNKEEKIWLREDYIYTTISGSRVPTKVTKWDENKKVIETYTYESIVIDGEAVVSPIKKERIVEAI